MTWFVLFLSLAWSQPSKPAIPLNNDHDVVNELTCPKLPEIFLDYSRKAYSAMADLYLTQEDRNSRLKEFFVNVLDFKKEESDHLEAYNKMREIKLTLSQKSKRAQEIYNNRLMELSPYIGKTKSCWSYFTPAQKKQVEGYLNDIQQKKSLSEFKKCINASTSLSKKREDEFNLGEQYFKKNITKQQLLTQGKKLDESINYYMKYLNKSCETTLKNPMTTEFLNDPKELQKVLNSL